MLDTEIHTTKHPTRSDDGRHDSGSDDAVGVKLQALEQMDYAALRSEWRRLYRSPPPKRVARDLLMLGVAWKIQEQAYGGLSAATRRRLVDLSKTMERDGGGTIGYEEFCEYFGSIDGEAMPPLPQLP